MADRVREIPGPAGPLEALMDLPPGPLRAAVVLAHPLPTKGGTMHTKVVFQAAKAMARIGCAVLRFNFRGVGSSPGTWDNGRGELDDFRAAVAYMAGQFPEQELWAAGFSFGSYIATTVGAASDDVCALIAIAPPVNHYRFDGLKTSDKPKFIVHGGRDELIPIRLVRQFYAQLPEPKELVEVDGADHLFDGQASEAGDALADLLEGFSCTKQ